MQWSKIFDDNNINYKDDLLIVNKTIDFNQKQNIKKENKNHDILYYDINNEEINTKLNNILNFGMNLNILENLTNGKFVTEYLSNYITYYHYLYEQNKINHSNSIKIDLNKLKKIIKWLIDFNSYYIKKLNLPHIHRRRNDLDIDINFIPRLRYDFCKHNSSCNFNYNKKKHKCKEDHYVYNKLYIDLIVILQYINKYEDHIIKHADILKNFKTINFVMKHMYDEFNQFAQYATPEEYHKFHIVN